MEKICLFRAVANSLSAVSFAFCQIVRNFFKTFSFYTLYTRSVKSIMQQQHKLKWSGISFFSLLFFSTVSYVYSIDDIAAAAAANQRTLVYIHDKHTKFFTMLRVLATFLLLPSRFFSHCQCKYTQKFSVRMSLCVYLFRIVNAVSVLYFFCWLIFCRLSSHSTLGHHLIWQNTTKC